MSADPFDSRPHRLMSDTGPEQTVVRADHDGDTKLTMRQVGWLGQSGAFYSLTENPAETERGSFSPLWFVADEDVVPADEPRAFVDVEVLTSHESAVHSARHPEACIDWRRLRGVRLDGREYLVPADSPVQVETVTGGPQLVTITFLAGDVRFVPWTPPGGES